MLILMFTVTETDFNAVLYSWLMKKINRVILLENGIAEIISVVCPVSGPYSGGRVKGVEHPQNSLQKDFWVYLFAEWPWQLILIHAILAGFSVEMILIAQTVIFMIFIRFPLWQLYLV